MECIVYGKAFTIQRSGVREGCPRVFDGLAAQVIYHLVCRNALEKNGQVWLTDINNAMLACG